MYMYIRYYVQECYTHGGVWILPVNLQALILCSDYSCLAMYMLCVFANVFNCMHVL